MKKIIVSILAIALVLSLSLGVSASQVVPDDSAMNFAEAQSKGIPYDKPLDQKSRSELLRDGAQFFGGTIELPPSSSRATTSGVLGYITASGSTTVYSGQGTGTNLGFVTFREIVYINSISGNYAYIQFKNASGVITNGYIANSSVYSPAYGWSTPLTSGKITQYYGEKITNSSGHTGTDVGGHNGGAPAVYATYAGTASFNETTKTLANGTKYFANYGKHIRLTTGNYDVNYAHLSSFGQSVSSNSYSSEGYPVPSNLTGVQASTNVIATKSVSKGATIGYVGTTGQSDGIHLHFEVRDNGTLKDPFTYVVFPNVSWAK